MLKLKRLACAALAAVMLTSAVSLSGCSTPEIAMTVDGTEYSTGVYLAYLYNTYFSLFYQGSYPLYYYTYQGKDPWAQKLPYGDDKTEMSVSDYIKLTTQDTIIRQKALENKLKEAKLNFLEKDVEQVNSTIKNMKQDALLRYGISKESYEKMLMAFSCNERALFYGTYDNNGSKAMSEDEIRKYFNDNYLSYKIIEIPLTDDDGKDLSEAEIKKVKERLQKYLNQYTTKLVVLKNYKEDSWKRAYHT